MTATARPQEAAGVPEEIRNDTDPTKPVLFSLRDEYYDLREGAWKNVFLLRADRIALKGVGLPGGAKGLVLRGDLPFVMSHDGTTTHSGLGDLYGQAIAVPAIHNSFTLAYGSGVVLPTATGDTLGSGKWQLAPLVAPVWYFGRAKGFAFVKVQDFFSLAGDGGRSDIHYLLATPTLLWRLSKTWFAVVDSESRTDWKNGSQTSFRSGLEIGTMLTPRFGIWIKPEISWGPHQTGDWTLKLTVFKTRY